MTMTAMAEAAAIAPQRAWGRGRLSAKPLAGRTRLAEFYQEGCAKIRLPDTFDHTMEAVLINSSGGLTGGDRLEWTFDSGEETHLTLTTQACEKIYKSSGGTATVDTRIEVRAGACVHWLPQETILFNGAKLDRETVVDLAEGAHFLGLETIVLGRAAMGETVTRLSLRDRRIIRRNGRIEVFDPFRLDDASLARAAGPALLHGARAVAVLILSAPGAEDQLPALRTALTEPDVTAAASALPGRVILRAHAPDAWPLRRQIARLIQILRPGALPRVWQSQEVT